MKRLLVICEGQTEETFVRELLGQHLQGRGIYASARLIGRPGHKGGIIRYARARRDIVRTLKEDRSAVCTTMFDFFRLPGDFPGMPVARELDSAARAAELERHLGRDIAEQMDKGFRPERFVPYIQMHEFEALLFSDPGACARSIGRPELESELRTIRQAFPSPEDINEGRETAPSKRLGRMVDGYIKPLHGTLAALEIGLERMRAECAHFADWLARLEVLAHRSD